MTRSPERPPDAVSGHLVFAVVVQMLEDQPGMELFTPCQLALQQFDLSDAKSTFFSNMTTKARRRPRRMSMGVCVSKFIPLTNITQQLPISRQIRKAPMS